MCSTCQKWLSDRKLGLSTVARGVVRFLKETWKLDRFFFRGGEIEIDRVVDSFIYESNYADTIFIDAITISRKSDLHGRVRIRMEVGNRRSGEYLIFHPSDQRIVFRSRNGGRYRRKRRSQGERNYATNQEPRVSSSVVRCITEDPPQEMGGVTRVTGSRGGFRRQRRVDGTWRERPTSDFMSHHHS